MSSVSKLILVLAAALALSACTDPKTYPISGEECGPEDPVLDVDASMANCTPAI
ncbi:hypothetical protein [uncultured Roseovarius sp.]|uniref:hypothetical protein n=1 Tax=uncultured Roseovarius sp. TaxID=293344 RepID=UPI0026382CE8|nr:hypothetical protein [uncultured Roseovarius sp.]